MANSSKLMLEVHRSIAQQIIAAMQENNVSRHEMAHRMGTCRPAVRRLISPKPSGLSGMTLWSLVRAAEALGLSVHIELRK